jgi:hypothetical protein
VEPLARNDLHIGHKAAVHDFDDPDVPVELLAPRAHGELPRRAGLAAVSLKLKDAPVHDDVERQPSLC